MEKNTKRCTGKLEKALAYIDEFIDGNDKLKIAKKITEYVFSFDNTLNRHSFAIKCYVTNKPDIRFCIDRGSDCEHKRTMTNFLCIKPPCEIHVIADGKPYLRPQRDTKFHIISTNDVIELGYSVMKKHIMESFCSRLKEYRLQSFLCK
jgi:hypothetical protein